MFLIFCLIFCFIFGIQVAGQSTTLAGAPLVPVVRMLHPVIAKASIDRQIAVLLIFINDVRVKAGLQALQLDDRLALAAASHASLMAQKG
jgi:hypothetical protein